MAPSSRTPEGEYARCSICGQAVLVEFSDTGDSVCPRCGCLVESNYTSGFVEDLLRRADRGEDAIELIMELEEELGITIPDDVAENLESVRSAIEYLLPAKRGSTTGYESRSRVSHSSKI